MKKWFNILQSDNIATIDIFDEIGSMGLTVQSFKNDFDAIKDSEKIIINVNSLGGEVFDGIAIYNILSTVREKVEINIMGITASIASVIAMSGSTINMYEGSFLVIHNPFQATVGDANKLRKEANGLDAIKKQIVSIYVNKTGLDENTINEMLDKETWLNPEQAKDSNFIDNIIKVEHPKNCLSIRVKNSMLKNIPENIMKLSIKDMTIRDYENILREVGFSNSDAKQLASAGYPKQCDVVNDDINNQLEAIYLKLI